MKHLNALKAVQRFAERSKQASLSPAELSLLQAQWRRAKRRADRLSSYYLRNRSYPYSSNRQLGIRGVNAPCIFWSGRVTA